MSLVREHRTPKNKYLGPLRTQHAAFRNLESDQAWLDLRRPGPDWKPQSTQVTSWSLGVDPGTLQRGHAGPLNMGKCISIPSYIDRQVIFGAKDRKKKIFLNFCVKPGRCVVLVWLRGALLFLRLSWPTTYDLEGHSTCNKIRKSICDFIEDDFALKIRVLLVKTANIGV